MKVSEATAEEGSARHSDEDADLAWMQGVAREWHTELANSREDIYTLEAGEPIRAASSDAHLD